MKVHKKERALGVDPRLTAFLDWWETHGPFELMVLHDGGIRADERRQQALFEQGRSRANTLSKTPHGRAGAVDVAPWVDSQVPWNKWDLFLCMGIIAEMHGLKWGGRWENLRDGPHLEVSDWQALPYPPPNIPKAG